MKYRDLREFMAGLERDGDLRRVADPVSARLEMTVISDKVLRAGGPALWFQNPAGYKISALTNLFGTTGRVAKGMGAESLAELRVAHGVAAVLHHDGLVLVALHERQRLRQKMRLHFAFGLVHGLPRRMDRGPFISSF